MFQQPQATKKLAKQPSMASFSQPVSQWKTQRQARAAITNKLSHSCPHGKVILTVKLGIESIQTCECQKCMYVSMASLMVRIKG